MDDPAGGYGLEFLLAFDGRVHHLEDGYWIKFKVKRVRPTKRRPHGLSYSLTLHAPDGARSDSLIVDFFDKVERVLKERGIGTTVVKVEETRRQK